MIFRATRRTFSPFSTKKHRLLRQVAPFALFVFVKNIRTHLPSHALCAKKGDGRPLPPNRPDGGKEKNAVRERSKAPKSRRKDKETRTAETHVEKGCRQKKDPLPSRSGGACGKKAERATAERALKVCLVPPLLLIFANNYLLFDRFLKCRRRRFAKKENLPARAKLHAWGEKTRCHRFRFGIEEALNDANIYGRGSGR